MRKTVGGRKSYRVTASRMESGNIALIVRKLLYVVKNGNMST